VTGIGASGRGHRYRKARARIDEPLSGYAPCCRERSPSRLKSPWNRHPRRRWRRRSLPQSPTALVNLRTLSNRSFAIGVCSVPCWGRGSLRGRGVVCHLTRRNARPWTGTLSRYSSRPGLEQIGSCSDLLILAAQPAARNTCSTPDLADKTGHHLRERHGNDLPLWLYQQS
jgi:hypothetical protein